MVTALAGLIRRDLRLALRQGSDAVLVLAFFVMAVLLFPFGVGPEPNLLARIAAGVIWSMALLAALLSFDRLFQADHEDGSLDLLALAPLPLAAIVLAKTAARARWPLGCHRRNRRGRAGRARAARRAGP